MQPLLTIAIPTYNRYLLLKRALNSIINQNDNRIEIIVSDNCSTDNTTQLMDEYCSKCINLHFYRNNKNLGVDVSFLKCFQLAKGKYILLLGSDDLFVEDGVKNLLSFLSRVDLPLVYLNHYFFQNDYNNKQSCYGIFDDNINNYYHLSKDDIIKISKDRITFMSSLVLKREEVLKVKEPESFIGTNFVHTCIAFSVSKNHQEFGYVGLPCIACDMTPSNTPLSVDMNKTFHIFGECMHYVLCEIGSINGFNKALLKNIYVNFAIKNWSLTIIKLKYLYGNQVIHSFKRFAYKPISNSLYAKFIILPVLYMPRFFVVFIMKYLKPIYRKIRY